MVVADHRLRCVFMDLIRMLRTLSGFIKPVYCQTGSPVRLHLLSGRLVKYLKLPE
jgi:hypothetical protein